MAAFISVLGMSAFLGVGSFIVGSLPLTFTFSSESTLFFEECMLIFGYRNDIGEVVDSW